MCGRCWGICGESGVHCITITILEVHNLLNYMWKTTRGQLVIATHYITQFWQHTLWIHQALFLDQQRISTSHACLSCLLHCQASHHRRTPKRQLPNYSLCDGGGDAVTKSMPTIQGPAASIHMSPILHPNMIPTAPVQCSQQHQAPTATTPPQYSPQTWAPLLQQAAPPLAG